jgi:hypothetical protein
LAQEFATLLPEAWSTHHVRVTRTRAAFPALPDARPLAVLVDDAHFLEPAAFAALPGLLDELGADAVVVVLTFRLGYHPAGSAETRGLAGLAVVLLMLAARQSRYADGQVPDVPAARRSRGTPQEDRSHEGQ